MKCNIYKKRNNHTKGTNFMNNNNLSKNNKKTYQSKNYKDADYHTPEGKNTLIIFRHTEKKLCHSEASVTNVQVTEGKITFFIENGSPIIFENKNLVRDVCTDDEPPSPNKYDSFWGKKSILEHHSSQIWNMATCYGAIADDSSLCFLSELLYDGVTHFILEDYQQSKESLKMFYMNA